MDEKKIEIKMGSLLYKVVVVCLSCVICWLIYGAVLYFCVNNFIVFRTIAEHLGIAELGFVSYANLCIPFTIFKIIKNF